MTILKRFALNVSDFITNMATMNYKFSNTMLNGSDFVAKTINVVKWGYRRVTLKVFETNHYSSENLGDIQCDFIFICYKEFIKGRNCIVKPGL